jgi:hypothetical protein
LLFTHSSLHFFVSEHFNNMWLASSSPRCKGHLPLSKPLLIPLRFQIPAFSYIIAILSFLVHLSM